MASSANVTRSSKTILFRVFQLEIYTYTPILQASNYLCCQSYYLVDDRLPEVNSLKQQLNQLSIFHVKILKFIFKIKRSIKNVTKMKLLHKSCTVTLCYDNHELN